MYAIHLETESSRVDLDELADAVSHVSLCRVEHVYAARPPHTRQLGVIFVLAASGAAAGDGVLEAVRHLLKEDGRPDRAEFRPPDIARREGLCHGVVRIIRVGAPDPVRSAKGALAQARWGGP
ncbi:hypothetical protein [Streptomyces sp. NPDC059814]|uniref:hypothetical protein n=1 Tax=unclassified Streptomyces TaxID=2593676 RepID=UPI00364600D5